jgi:cytochrome c-type biogenesis protein CcmH
MITRPVLASLMAIGLWFALAVSGLAQTPTPNEVDAVAKNLWCPLCNGVRLDNCELQACVQMKEVIAQKLEAGQSQEQIRAYFVQQYGDVVLGAPSTQGFSGLAWILPVLAGAVGIAWLVYFVTSLTRKRSPEPQADSAAGAGSSEQALEEEYLQRVNDELDKYQ